jgi:hypothetical protein
MTCTCRVVENGEPDLGIDVIGVGPVLEQPLDDVEISPIGMEGQRGLVIVGWAIGVRARLQESLEQAISSQRVDDGIMLFVKGVDVDAVLEEAPEHGLAADVKQGIARIEGTAGAQQSVDDRDVVGRDRYRPYSLVVLVDRVRARAAAEQVADRLGVALVDGCEQLLVEGHRTERVTGARPHASNSTCASRTSAPGLTAASLVAAAAARRTRPLRQTPDPPILALMGTAAARELPDPIIIYRSVDRDGQTFALDPLSRDRLREIFGDAAHFYPRVFIAHETKADYERLRSDLAAQVVALLTGIAEPRLEEHGGVSFVDPVTEEELARR